MTTFILAAVVAVIAWTVTHEKIFEDVVAWFKKKHEECENPVAKKAFYMPTCEYCFSHWVTILVLIVTKYQLLFNDWRGYVIAGFTIVAIANIYMTIYFILRKLLVYIGELGKIKKVEAAFREEYGL